MRSRFSNVSIVGVAHVDAPHRIPSREIDDRLMPLYQRLGIAPGLLEGLAGIAARRFWDEGVKPSDAAAMAGEAVLKKTGIDRAKVGMLVSTSVCRDYVEPSTACITHAKLGLAPECLNFDLGNACLGFINGMEMVGHMIERGQLDYGLVVDGEGSRYTIETTIERLLGPETDEKSFREQFATLTLGSGGAAMLLARSDLDPTFTSAEQGNAPSAEAAQRWHRFTGAVSLAATEYHNLCWGQMDRMYTHTKKLLFAGLELAQKTWDKARRELEWTADSLDECVLHQVSQVHTTQLADLLGLNPSKILSIFPEYGNVGPASVPIVLSKSEDAGRLKPGARVGLMGIGSGLNCAMAEVIW